STGRGDSRARTDHEPRGGDPTRRRRPGRRMSDTDIDIGRIRILVADDHPVYRDGLRALAARSPDLELVGEAATGTDAVALADSSQPDVILMDLRMPEMSGIEATRAILERRPETRVLILTMSEDDDSLFAAM